MNKQAEQARDRNLAARLQMAKSHPVGLRLVSESKRNTLRELEAIMGGRR